MDFSELMKETFGLEAKFATNPHTARDLVDMPRLKDKVRISIGYRPSGVIHLGNLITFLLAASMAETIGPHKTEICATNQDLDLMGDRRLLPDLGLSIKKRKAFVPVFKYAEKEGVNCADANGKMIENILQEISDYTGVSIRTNRMSDISKTGEFRTLLKNVLDNSESLLPFFDDDRAEKLKKTGGGLLIYPVDPETKISTLRGTIYKNGMVRMPMPNLGKTIEFDIMDPDYDLSLHFLLSPLRDLTNSYQADVHVHGGDRVEQCCEDDFTKIERTAAVLAASKSKNPLPVLTVGPVIYGPDGRKMSKSLGNGLTYDQIKDNHQGEYIGILINYFNHIVENNIKNVDFNLTREYLL